jgi:hypothetical protein
MEQVGSVTGTVKNSYGSTTLLCSLDLSSDYFVSQNHMSQVVEEGSVLHYWLLLQDCKSGRLLVSLEFR